MKLRTPTLVGLVLLVLLVIGVVLYYVAMMGDADDTAARSGPKGRLVIFHAGSLSVPVRQLAEHFEAKHPGIKVMAEAAGSRHCARKISELGRRCDVFGSADYRVVENLLIPKHAAFNIRFATNEMAIAYHARSRRAAEINAQNWPDILLSEGVRFGRSDPNSDPCGYRTVMVFQLAERHFQRPGLAAQLEARHGRKFIRPKETDLLALLEAGEIDYLFIYRSVVAQHRLRMVRLPDAVNLRSPGLAARYRQAKVPVSGKRPGQQIVRTGEPMVYSVTIPKSAPNPRAAAAFVALLLSPDGQAIIERNGQPFIRPPVVDGWKQLPRSLKKLLPRRPR